MLKNNSESILSQTIISNLKSHLVDHLHLKKSNLIIAELFSFKIKIDINLSKYFRSQNVLRAKENRNKNCCMSNQSNEN